MGAWRRAGSGKTLVYIASIIDALRKQERAGTLTRAHRPRAIVVVPSKELADQVRRVAAAICSDAPVRTLELIGLTRRRTLRLAMADGVDVVLATPGVLLRALNRRTGRWQPRPMRGQRSGNSCCLRFRGPFPVGRAPRCD